MRTPVLRVDFRPCREGVYDGTYGHVDVSVCVWDDKDEDDNADGQWQYNPPQYLYYGEGVSPFWNLKMSCQTDTEHMRADREIRAYIDRFYGIELEWSHAGACTLRHMKEGIKPMQRLHAKLDKIADEAGYATSMGQYIFRLATATGIRHMFIAGLGPVRYHSPSYAQLLIDEEVDKWIIRKSEVTA